MHFVLVSACLLGSPVRYDGAHKRSSSEVLQRWLELEQAKRLGVRVAVLKEGSPSCGSSYIHDGSFTGTKVSEKGVTAALLESSGVSVFSEDQFVEANAFLLQREAAGE